MTDAQGRIIAGRYRLTEPVGRGGMGVVWRARDEVLDRDVAVKEILSPPELDEAERRTTHRRAIREARSAARLSHPGVVTVHDVVEEDGRPWVVMELVHARSLQEIIDRDGPLAPGRVGEIGRQILAALSAAHAVGILHRDVKPGNVLVTADDRIVLTDFGIAVIEGEATLTRTGSFVGSPAYIAPERVRGQKATPAADLWGLGVTLHTAATGRPPFHRDDAVAVLGAVLEEEPAPLPSGGFLGRAVQGLLDKDPDRRLTATGALPLLAAAATTDAGSAATRLEAPSPPLTAVQAPGAPLGTGLAARFAYAAAAVMALAALCGLALPDDLSEDWAQWPDLTFVVCTTLVAMLHVPIAIGLFQWLQPDRPDEGRAVLLAGLLSATLLVIAMVVSAARIDIYHRWPDEPDLTKAGGLVIVLAVVAGAWLPLTGVILWRRAPLVAVAGGVAYVLWVVVLSAVKSHGDLATTILVLLPIVYGTWAIGLGRVLRGA